MGHATIRYRPLAGEPRWYPRRRPLSALLGVARLALHALLALGRLLLTTVILLIAGLLLLNVALDGRTHALDRPSDHLAHVLRTTAGWLTTDGDSTLVSETSSAKNVPLFRLYADMLDSVERALANEHNPDSFFQDIQSDAQAEQQSAAP